MEIVLGGTSMYVGKGRKAAFLAYASLHYARYLPKYLISSPLNCVCLSEDSMVTARPIICTQLGKSSIHASEIFPATNLNSTSRQPVHSQYLGSYLVIDDGQIAVNLTQPAPLGIREDGACPCESW